MVDDEEQVSAAIADAPVTAILGPLARALSGTKFAGADLHPLVDSGLAHHHVRLDGHAVLARVPKQSQMGLDARRNLAYQAACFDRASRSGHVPRLVDVLDPAAELPRGALLVEYVEGRRPALPGDLASIMTALARVHALPLPDPAQRPPLANPSDAVGALTDEIEVQSRYLDAARLHASTRAIIESERMRLAALRERRERPARALISFDAHPGNFVVRPGGEAVLVDMEKCRYGYPALDLAHATLYTSTTWEPGDPVALSPAEVVTATRTWAAAVTAAGAGRLADDLDWHLPLRRAMWLWSMTWCAKWRALSGRAPAAHAEGEDWSTAHDTDALAAHVRDRVDHYLEPDTAERVEADFDASEWSELTGAATSR